MREYTSITNATYTHPEWVFTYVMSATHSRFGAGAANWRSTRSAGRSKSWFESVVTVQVLPRRLPTKPMSRINRSTVQRATRMPSALSWAQILAAPYTNMFAS